MEVTVDNIWTSPSTLHLRVCVIYGRGNALQKHDVAIPLDSLDAVDARHIVLVLGRDLLPLPEDQPLPGL